MHIFHFTYGSTYFFRYISRTIVSSIFTHKRFTYFFVNVLPDNFDIILSKFGAMLTSNITMTAFS